MKINKSTLFVALLVVLSLALSTTISFASSKVEITVDLVEEVQEFEYIEEDIPVREPDYQDYEEPDYQDYEEPNYNYDYGNNGNSSNNSGSGSSTPNNVHHDFDMSISIWEDLMNTPTSNTGNANNSNTNNGSNGNIKIDNNEGDVVYVNNGGWSDDDFIEFTPPSINDYTYYPSSSDNYYEDNYGYDYSFDNDYYGYENEEENKKIRSGKTVHYVLNVNDKYPIYRDTGIRVSDENIVNYEEAKDILNQIVVMKKSKIVEDIDKFIALVNGKIILVNNSDSIDINSIISQLEGTTSIVKVLDTRMGGRFNLSDYVEFNKDINIKVNNKPLDLTIQPIVENSRVLLPVRDIAEALGAKVTWNKEKAEAKIVKGDKTIIFTKDSDIAVSNGDKYKLSNPSRTTEDERMFILSQFLVSELGAIMEWDAKELTLVINTKK